MTAQDFLVSTPFGWVDGYPLNQTDPVNHPGQGFHNGVDYGCPIGTAIVVNGVKIGVSGATGEVTGPHCHVGHWRGATVINPGSGGWSVSGARVSEIGEDAMNGKWVRLADADGSSWVYLHMSDNHVLNVGDVLSDQPQYNENQEEDMYPNTGDVHNAYLKANRRNATDEEVSIYTSKPWNAVDGLLYGKIYPDFTNAQNAPHGDFTPVNDPSLVIVKKAG